jgi:hypothetical protein
VLHANAASESIDVPSAFQGIATRYRDMGYPVFSGKITWSPQTGKKRFKFPKDWPTCTLANCLEAFVRNGDDALMINTTRCDLLCVDIDVKDGGMAAWAALEQAHGGPVHAPKVRTGWGGDHVYFSFSKSVAAGLLSNTPTTFAKLKVGDDLVGIDLRGNSSPACLVAPPTTYVDGAGATVGYVAAGTGIPHIADLPPLPPFLIDLLHQRVTRPAGGDRGGQARAHGPERPERPLSEEPDLSSPELQAEVVCELTRLLCGWGDNTSVFSEAVASSVGTKVLYKFRNGPQGRAACPYFPAGTDNHDSNHFGLLRRGVEISYICHGERCKTETRANSIQLGALPFPVAASFSNSQPLNSERNRLYVDRELLPMAFLRENLNVHSGEWHFLTHASAVLACRQERRERHLFERRLWQIRDRKVGPSRRGQERRERHVFGRRLWQIRDRKVGPSRRGQERRERHVFRGRLWQISVKEVGPSHWGQEKRERHVF